MHAIFLARMLTRSYIVDCCTDLYKRLGSSRMKTKCFYGTWSSLVEIFSFLKIKSILRTEFQKSSVHFINSFPNPYNLRLCVKSFVGSAWDRTSWRILVKHVLIEKKWFLDVQTRSAGWNLTSLRVLGFVAWAVLELCSPGWLETCSFPASPS